MIKCIPITEKKIKEINERMAQNLRDAKITHLPPGIERLEVNLKSFIEVNEMLEREGKCQLSADQNFFIDSLLTIIEYVRQK